MVATKNRISENGKAPANGKVTKDAAIVIDPLNIVYATFTIRGDAPLVMNRFSRRVQEELVGKQKAGQDGKNTGKTRDPKDFELCFEEAKHKIANGKYKGRYGIPASGLRSAMIRATSLVGHKMTMAKCTVFVIEDGFGDDGCPLVVIECDEPEQTIMPVRNSGPAGVIDFRARPMFQRGWTASVTLRFDSDQFSTQSVANLLHRAGQQVGICEGRPFSRNSTGMGWGTFVVGSTAKE